MSEAIRVVIYAAKSTEDKRGSIPDQLADCRRMAEREGGKVIGEFADENASAWKGNRGPQLVAAMELAEREAPCVLCVQHSDRLARGDGQKARHLVEVVLWGIKAGVTIRSVEDDLFADERIGLLMGAVMGTRNTEDSSRKSEAVQAGLKRRRESGKPVGAIPLGYVAESDESTTRRVIDPATAPTVERIFALVEAGASFGDVARTLNAEGIKTRRGGSWVSRTVRTIVHNRAYVGDKGYPQIIDPDRFDAIQANLARLDPVQLAKRKGGRRNDRDDSYFLRGIAFCGDCGASLYTREQAVGRVYVCANRRQGTGLCSAPPIPAKLIEDHVLRHLDSFVGSVEEWISDRLAERDRERRTRETALERQRGQLRELDRKRTLYVAEYERLMAEGASSAYVAGEVVERADAERAEQLQRIEEAEAVVREWSGPPDMDAALDFYNRLVDHVQGRIEGAQNVRDLNDALSTVVAGLWAEVEEDRERLLIEFELLTDSEQLPGGAAITFKQRPTLPPRMLDDHTESGRDKLGSRDWCTSSR
jgi:DNA invertase Pin-like site-specific DNA recombinase